METRWYEIRKRAVLLSSLPHERYESALEIGCSTGVLTEELASRCDRVVAVDLADNAVEIARRRLADHPHVQVRQGDVSTGLPSGPWDLVVISEVAYYLDPLQWVGLVDDVGSQLAESGALAVCHWRHPAGDFRQSGDAVHTTLAARTTLTSAVHHEERDFVLDIYTRGSSGRKHLSSP